MDGKLLRFRAGDAVAIALVVLLAGAVALLFFRPKTEALYADVYQNGTLLYTLPLDRDTRLTVGGAYENVLVVSNGTIRIESATCPGEDCVHTGAIGHAGQSIVCLPNRLEIRLSGDSGVDIIAR